MHCKTVSVNIPCEYSSDSKGFPLLAKREGKTEKYQKELAYVSRISDIQISKASTYGAAGQFSTYQIWQHGR